MRIFKDYNQKQTFLLPPSIEEFVPAKHPARIISDVVDTIDISSIAGKYNGGGSSAYHPSMMLKIMKWNRAHLIMNLRGKRKVRGEFILMCLAHNIGKIIRKIQTKTEENQASSGVLMVIIDINQVHLSFIYKNFFL